jgi:hypothetical protein
MKHASQRVLGRCKGLIEKELSGWEAGIRNHSRRAASTSRCFPRETSRAAKRPSKICEGDWLGGRDSNPDNVVQRAVNVFRFALVRSVLLGFSPPALRLALVRSGLFLCRMSHCVSGRSGRGPETKPPDLLFHVGCLLPGTAHVRRRVNRARIRRRPDDLHIAAELAYRRSPRL